MAAASGGCDVRILLLWVAYQAFWLTCILGAQHGWQAAAPLAFVLFVGVRFTVGTHAGWRSDAIHAVQVGIVGFAMESLLVTTGILRYALPWPSATLAPAWIGLIWMAFALSLRDGLTILHGRPRLAGALGALLAPLSYMTAALQFGVLSFPQGMLPAWLALAATWLLAMPLMLYLMRLSDTGSAARHLHLRGAHGHGH